MAAVGSGPSPQMSGTAGCANRHLTIRIVQGPDEWAVRHFGDLSNWGFQASSLVVHTVAADLITDVKWQWALDRGSTRMRP